MQVADSDGNPGARIFSLSTKGIEEVAHEDTEHFMVTKTFLQNPDRMLQQILAKDDEEDKDQSRPVT